jgi:hypothetical protein
MSFEGQNIFYSDQNLVAGNADGGNQRNADDLAKDEALMKYMHFILEWQERNTYIYR